jgi:H+/Cl- antiporter ClcA
MVLPMGQRQWLIIDTLLLGVVGALSAQVFTLMLKGAQALFLNVMTGYIPPGLPEEGGVLKQVIDLHGLWLVPSATTLGGLISDFPVYSLAPEAEGHRTDTAVKAFHRAGGSAQDGGFGHYHWFRRGRRQRRSDRADQRRDRFDPGDAAQAFG